MKKVYRTKQEMIDDFIENENNKMMNETFEINNNPFIILLNKLLPFIVIVFTAYLVLALLGGITISKRNYMDLRFDVSITDEVLTSTVNTTYRKTLIPLVLYSGNNFSAFYNYTSLKELYKNLNRKDNYWLEVTAYNCYYLQNEIKGKTFCRGYSDDEIVLAKTDVAKYLNLQITDVINDKVVYNGKLIKDITEYVASPSKYQIAIKATYDNNHATATIKAYMTTN